MLYFSCTYGVLLFWYQRVAEPFFYLYLSPKAWVGVPGATYFAACTLAAVGPWHPIGLKAPIRPNDFCVASGRVVQDQAPASWSDQWNFWEGCHKNSLPKMLLLLRFSFHTAWIMTSLGVGFKMLIADDCSVIGPHWSSKSACTSPRSFYEYHLLLLMLEYHKCRMASRFQSWHVQPKEEIAYEKAATEVWPSHGVLCVLGVKWEDRMLAMAINGKF